MSYIEDNTWKTNDGSPIMVLPTKGIEGIELRHPLLVIYYSGWCEHCVNPDIRWTIFDTTGEALSSSIGGHVTLELAEEDAYREVRYLS